MALGATVYHFGVQISDVDRGTYAAVDLRLARHPSESARYLLTRTLAYCLCYEEGIAFSKGGLSDSEDPPVSIPDGAGGLSAWIDVGAPSAKRLHKASKAAAKVILFTHVDRKLLIAEAASARIHRVKDIEVWTLDAGFLERAEAKLDRKLELTVTRNDGTLYLGIGGETLETPLTCTRLFEDNPWEDSEADA
jgi:uncharacterized protein YaeQ